ncbi:Ribosomal protein L21-like [Trinorchestia longiramus]|nr:Ribosomal protein L21-like [Trinorchestia longiramus]
MAQIYQSLASKLLTCNAECAAQRMKLQVAMRLASPGLQLPGFCQVSPFSCSSVLAVLPPKFEGNVTPNRDRPYIDQFIPRVRIVPSKKTAVRPPMPHKFWPVKRSWNLREIPSDEEAWQKHGEIAPCVVEQVNKQLEEGRAGRLFAVVHVAGQQFIIKSEDLIIIKGHWAPKLGESIRLEKVLLMGGRDFSLIGRPLLPLDQVYVDATVVEKTLSNTKIWFVTIPRGDFKRTKYIRESLTYLRINRVCVLNKVNELPDVERIKGTVISQADE